MNIVEVCIRFGAPGGAEAHVAAMARELAARGHTLTVVTSDLYTEVPWQRGGAFAEPPRGVDVVRLPTRPRSFPLRPLRMEGLDRALARTGADVFHAHSHRYHHLRTTAAVARRLRKPYVVTPHFHPLEEGAGAWKRLIAWGADRFDAARVYRGAAQVVTVTDLEQRFLAGLARPGSMTTIPNGLDASAWAQPADARRFRGATGVEGDYVLYAGRLASNKGLGTLLDAFARIAPEHPHLDVVLAGTDWGEGALLRKRAAALGLSRRVHLVGHLDDAAYRSAVAGCRAFVLPSHWEAFGISLLEAQAAGRACVATAVGGVPEVVRDGVDGLLVPYGDAAALAAALDRVLREPALAARLGSAGREKALKHYDWPVLASRLEHVLAASPSRRPPGNS